MAFCLYAWVEGRHLAFFTFSSMHLFPAPHHPDNPRSSIFSLSLPLDFNKTICLIHCCWETHHIIAKRVSDQQNKFLLCVKPLQQTKRRWFNWSFIPFVQYTVSLRLLPMPVFLFFYTLKNIWVWDQKMIMIRINFLIFKVIVRHL